MQVRYITEDIGPSYGSRISSPLDIVLFLTLAIMGLTFQLIGREYTWLLSLLILLSAVLIFWRPVAGIALYLAIYPGVPSEGRLNSLKIMMFALTIILLASYWARALLAQQKRLDRQSYRLLYIFFGYLAISPLIGMFSHNYSPVDWARDIAALLNLLLIPVMADYFRPKENRWLLYLVLVPFFLTTVLSIHDLMGINAQDTASLKAEPSFGMAYLHPSMGIGLSLLMFTHRAPWRWLWGLFGLLCLTIVFLTPTRTIWITTGTMILMVIAFSYKNKVTNILIIGAIVFLTGLVVFYMLNPEKNKEIQVKKFHGIENYDEDDSIQNRVEEMDQCLGLFKSSPFFGKGFGFQYHFWRIYVKAEGGPGWLDTNFTHSDLMFLLSKGGILGTSIFCIMLYGLLKNSWRLRLDATDKQQFLWATFSILMIINSVIIGLSTPIYQARFHMFTFAVILAYVYSFDAPFGYAEYRISSADGDNK